MARKPLPFHPRAGQVLIADFKDFVEPEITKLRPVVVISPRLPHRGALVTIVPLSTKPPRHKVPYVHRLAKNYTPWVPPSLPSWAICDLVMNFGLHRLSAFKIDRRKFHTPEVSPDDLKGIRAAVLAGLGFVN